MAASDDSEPEVTLPDGAQPGITDTAANAATMQINNFFMPVHEKYQPSLKTFLSLASFRTVPLLRFIVSFLISLCSSAHVPLEE